VNQKREGMVRDVGSW